MGLWQGYPEIHKELIKVENYMKEVIPSRKKILTDICLELIEAGGKRLRPAFVIIGAKFGRFDEIKIIPLAASMELLHTATLVHDDIIDDSELRRGRVTVQAKWGEDMAVYVGDYLFTKAFTILSDKMHYEYLNRIAHAFKTICEGEIDQYEIKYNMDVSVTDYLKRIYRKTAVLFVMSILTGAYEGKCKRSTIHALGKFASFYGMAFQVYDDLLDYLSSEEIEGKPIGNDIRQGIYTLPLLYALKDQKTGPEIKKFLSKKADISNEEIQQVIQLVKETRALDLTRELKEKFVKKALSALDNLSDSDYKNICIDLVKLL
ncbi:MAG: polyprenyl synthetase family protein [Epulopiscium sp.]|jgi:heptaprenyl diphosphate synthase|nr:polyprenyl synthetase family protein [Candidatus Epulonipiscium sp.]